MKTFGLVAAFVAVSTAAMAQSIMAPFMAGQLPVTVKLNDRQGNFWGTGTISRWPDETRMVIRKDGQLFGTVVFKRDGTRAVYDPEGKLIPPPPIQEVEVQP